MCGCEARSCCSNASFMSRMRPSTSAMITGCSDRSTWALIVASWSCAITMRTERSCSATSATVSLINRAEASSAGDHGSDLPSTSWCHCAKERRGDRSDGSSPMMTALSGSPPQVTVLTCSGLNQSRYSPSLAESGAAIRPLAIGRRSMKDGSSSVSAAVTVRACGAGSVVLRRRSSQAARSRMRCVDGTSPAVVTWPSNSSAAPVAPSGCSSDCEPSNNAACHSPSRETASTSRCSSRRTTSSDWLCAKLSSAAIRIAQVSASASQAARISNGTKRGS